MRGLLLLLLLLGCGKDAAPTEARAVPADAHGQECAVCGMVVDEQPAPRGQAAFRGGKHRFYCSIGDLRAGLQNPDASGAPAAVWVEALAGSFDPGRADAELLPWIPAAQASFAVGFERGGVMGRPAASFATASEAEAFAARAGGRAVGWEALRTAPFAEDP